MSLAFWSFYFSDALGGKTKSKEMRLPRKAVRLIKEVLKMLKKKLQKNKYFSFDGLRNARKWLIYYQSDFDLLPRNTLLLFCTIL